MSSLDTYITTNYRIMADKGKAELIQASTEETKIMHAQTGSERLALIPFASVYGRP